MGPRAGPLPRARAPLPVGAAPGWALLRLETSPLFKLRRPCRGVPWGVPWSGCVHGGALLSVPDDPAAPGPEPPSGLILTEGCLQPLGEAALPGSGLRGQGLFRGQQ